MKKLLKIVISILLLAAFYSCSKNENVLGTVNNKEITIDSFKKDIQQKYDIPVNKIPIKRIPTIFRQYYSAYAFYKEGEANKIFESEQMKQKIDKTKKQMMLRHIQSIWHQKEIEPTLVLKDSDFEMFRRKLKVRHILVKFKNKNNALALINKISGELKKGKSFQELAKQYSEDQGSKSKGGDLGWVTQGSPLVDAFKKAVFQGTTGKVIGPVKTIHGYHLILIEKEEKVSIEAIKKDKRIPNLIKNEKRKKFMNRMFLELRERYKDKIHYYPERIKNIKKYQDQDIYRVDGAISLTVGDVAIQMGRKLKDYQSDPKRMDPVVNRIINNALIYLEAVSKGLSEDANLKKRLTLSLIFFKQKLYQDYLRNQYEGKVASDIKEKDIENYYKKRINFYSRSLPNFIKKEDFNNLYLNKISNKKDKDLLLKYYEYDGKQSVYKMKRISVQEQNDLWRILNRIGYSKNIPFKEVKDRVKKDIIRREVQDKIKGFTLNILKKYNISFQGK